MNKLKMLQVQDSPNLTDLSHELLCQIIKYLPLKEVLALSTLCKKLSAAVGMHLCLCKSIDFCQDKIYGYMPASITDDHMHSLLKKCPHLETVYGLHPLKVERRRLRKRSALTVPGIIEALCLCYNLKAIETCDLKLLEAVMQVLPQLEIIGNFRNRDGVFPPHASQRLKLQPYPRISSLHLIGVEVPELTAMPHLQHLHLQCVRFTKLQPFRAFLAQNLKTFVMKHCMGPSVSLRYLSLIIALSSSPSLNRLELVRVPLPGGLFQRAVEDSYRHNGFVNLKTLIIAGCKGVLESDLGHLMIVASKNLESLSIQPSLTKDSLFVSLSFAQCEFPKLKNLHLGYVDKLNSSGEWSNDVLLTLGLAEVPDTPSSLTDSGMRVISELFPRIKTMSVSNCPHLMAMDQWCPVDGVRAWKELTDLTLQKCHCLQLPSFSLFLALLPKIEVVILNDMFREPPKGCSHVGLSAGTGLGMSSAVVSNQDEHIAVQGHQQDFEPQGDEQVLENDEIDRDYVEADNEIRPEPHLMVLPQDFFDEQNNVVHVPVEIRENVNDEINVADDNGNNLNPVQAPAGSVNYNDHQVQEETTDDDSETDDDDDDGTVASPSVTPNEASSAFIKQEIEDEDDYASSSREIMQNVSRIKREITEYDYLQPSTSSQNPYCVKIENKKDECKKISEMPGTNLNNSKQSKYEKEINDLSEETARSHQSSSSALNVDSVDSSNNMPSCSKTSKKTNKVCNMDSRNDRDGTCVNDCACLKAVHSISDSKRYANFDPQQPSTSKVVDCPEYYNADLILASRKNVATQSDLEDASAVNCSEFSNADLMLDARKSVATQSDFASVSVTGKRKMHEEKVKNSKKKRKCNKEEFSESNQISSNSICKNKRKNQKETFNNNPEDFLHFRGPLTRQRRKMLAAYIKKESVTCAIENQKNEKRACATQVQMNSGQCRICLNGDCCRKKNAVSSGAGSQNGLRETGCTCKHSFQNKLVRNRRCSSKHNSSCALKTSCKTKTSDNKSCSSKRNKSSHTNSYDSGMHLQSSERHNSFTVKKTNFEANKTEENIAIKKCRFSHGSELAHHVPCVKKKKGKVVCNHTQEYVTSQGTQATSADIRRTLRRFRTSKVRTVKLSSKAPGFLDTFSVSATKQYKRCKLPKSKDMQNKATSTSDPLMEDDAVQTLRLVSETLISLTIVSCGISHIVIDHCLRMTHVEVQACRILKKFQLNYCPRVKRVNISQCPKLAAETFFPEIISLSTVNSLLVSFEPCMQSYHPIDGERMIFSKATPDQSIVVFHDYTDNSHEIVQAVFKESLLGWMELVQRIYLSLNLLRTKKIENKSIAENSRKARYPWGHDLRRIHGFYMFPPAPNPCATEWKYEMLTNNHVFARAFEFLPWDKGVPRAEFCGNYHKLPIYPFILYEVAERTVQMPKTLTTFYIPITESN